MIVIKELFRELNEKYHFDKVNPRYEEEWVGNVFLRPTKTELHTLYTGEKQHGGDGKSAYIKKAHLACKAGHTIVLLLPAETEKDWFHDYVLANFYHIRWLRGAIDDRGLQRKHLTSGAYIVVTMAPPDYSLLQ